MIDNFALAVSHGLILLAAWLLTRRADLEREGEAPPKWRKPRDHGGA